MRSLPVLILLCSVAHAADPPVTIVRMDPPRDVGQAIVCPVGRLVIVQPNVPDDLLFLSSDPDGADVDTHAPDGFVRGIKFDEPAGTTATKVYRFTGAKGPVSVIYPRRDITLFVLQSGQAGKRPMLLQTLTISVTGPRPPPEPPDPLPDSLMTPLRGAWSQEAGLDRVKYKASLAAVYRQSANIVDKQEVATVGQLYTAIRAASKALVPDDALPIVRATLGEYLRANAPTNVSQALDEQVRRQIKGILSDIARGLETLK